MSITKQSIVNTLLASLGLTCLVLIVKPLINYKYDPGQLVSSWPSMVFLNTGIVYGYSMFDLGFLFIGSLIIFWPLLFKRSVLILILQMLLYAVAPIVGVVLGGLFVIFEVIINLPLYLILFVALFFLRKLSIFSKSSYSSLLLSLTVFAILLLAMFIILPLQVSLSHQLFPNGL